MFESQFQIGNPGSNTIDSSAVWFPTMPDFERKATDIIGLYLDPPRHAALFCVDEKVGIQVLDRRDRLLPLSPGRSFAD